MNKFSKLCIFSIILTLGPSAVAQFKNYRYQREIKGVSEQWHKIAIPPEVFGNVSPNLSDLRIYGVSRSNDTIEVPYVLQQTTAATTSREVMFKQLNTSQNDQGYYFTFEVPSEEPLNKIYLDFLNKNFDWTARLEGSHDQKEWFTLVDEQRLVAVNNEEVDFKYTILKLKPVRYHYLRLRVNSKEKPLLSSASIVMEEQQNGRMENYETRKVLIEENPERKETLVTIPLMETGRPSLLNLSITDPVSYYRPIRLSYLSDSIKTEKGWKRQYKTLKSAVLNSMENNEISFPGTTTAELQLRIKNHDNTPLSIDSITVKGYVHELTARFDKPATYYLAYGNPKAGRPVYDIAIYPENIPDNALPVTLEEETKTSQLAESKPTPLITNKFWLWIIMGIIIFSLGWFSLKMIRNQEALSRNENQ